VGAADTAHLIKMSPVATHSDVAQWVERIRAGEVRALARAISSIENNESQSLDLLKAVFPHSGAARILGLTGAPGAGKSTLVDQLAREYRKQSKTDPHAGAPRRYRDLHSQHGDARISRRPGTHHR
jgi:ATPase subunit of ABC transporter with duplicated ATPase domains